MLKLTTKSEQETLEYAKKFAAGLRGGEVIGLSGDLGAGKTVFAKGLAAGLGVAGNVNSPTFVIMKVYKTTDNRQQITGSKINNFVHIDAYRLGTADDIKAIGAQDYFGRPDTVTVIEWPEKILSFLNAEYMHFQFSGDNNLRIITYERNNPSAFAAG